MAQNGRVRLGVAGVGVMGELHCRLASQMRDFELVGVYDPDAERAGRIAELHETRRCASFDDLVARVDAVIIAAPSSAHASLALAALAAGVHVLVEKPIAATREEAMAVIAAAEASGRICLVGHTERYNVTFRELCAVLGDERPIAIAFERLSPYPSRRIDTDVILDLMTHDLELVLALTNEVPVSVSAVGLRLRSDGFDHVDAVLAFPSGTIASLTASRVTEQKVRRIEVTAAGRYIVADLLTRTLVIHRGALPEFGASGTFRLESVTQQVHVPPVEPLLLELSDFAEAVRSGRPPLVSGADGLRVLDLALLLRERAERATPRFRSVAGS